MNPLGMANGLEKGTVVKGRVIAVENDAVLIDVGLEIRRRAGGARRSSPPAAASPTSMSATPSGSYLERIWRTRTAKPSCRAKRRGARRPGLLLEKSFQANERVTTA